MRQGGVQIRGQGFPGRQDRPPTGFSPRHGDRQGPDTGQYRDFGFRQPFATQGGLIGGRDPGKPPEGVDQAGGRRPAGWRGQASGQDRDQEIDIGVGR